MTAVPAALAGSSNVAEAMPPEVKVWVGVIAPTVLETTTGVPSRAMPLRVFLTETRTLVVLPQVALPGTVTETWFAVQLVLAKLLPMKLAPPRRRLLFRPPPTQPQFASRPVDWKPLTQ